jgi:hypothetical protein
MGDEERLTAALEERSKNQAERIEKLETNQRWGIMTILGLIAKTAFDYLNGGPQP